MGIQQVKREEGEIERVREGEKEGGRKRGLLLLLLRTRRHRRLVNRVRVMMVLTRKMNKEIDVCGKIHDEPCIFHFLMFWQGRHVDSFSIAADKLDYACVVCEVYKVCPVCIAYDTTWDKNNAHIFLCLIVLNARVSENRFLISLIFRVVCVLGEARAEMIFALSVICWLNSSVIRKMMIIDDT